MAKPGSLPTWATDTNLASGTQSGQTTKLEPSAGIKAQGNIPGFGAPGRWYNWLFNLIYQWCAYLDNLHNEVQFLNKLYLWTSTHVWKNVYVGLSGTSEVRYTDDAGALAARSLEMLQPLRGQGGDPLAGWVKPSVTDVYVETHGPNIKHVITIEVPRASGLNRVRACVDQASGTGQINMKVYQAEVDLTGATAATMVQLGTTQSTVSQPGFELLSVDVGATVSNAARYYVVEFESSSGATNLLPDRIHWVRCRFDDYGPING